MWVGDLTPDTEQDQVVRWLHNAGIDMSAITDLHLSVGARSGTKQAIVTTFTEDACWKVHNAARYWWVDDYDHTRGYRHCSVKFLTPK